MFEDSSLLEVSICLQQLNVNSKEISSRGNVTGLNEAAWALKALTLTDLTTLAGDDTKSNVSRLCHRAAFPFPNHFLASVEPDVRSSIHTGAVCVYPSRVADAYDTLYRLEKHHEIPVAAVATGFPTGQYPLKTRIEEIQFAIDNGATEVDIVINRPLALCEKWEAVYNEVCAMRRACGNKARLKTILAVGDLGSMENVRKY